MSVCRLPEAVLTAEHPGPIVSYTWNGIMLPPWLVDLACEATPNPERPMEAAIIESVCTTAQPHRYNFDR